MHVYKLAEEEKLCWLPTQAHYSASQLGKKIAAAQSGDIYIIFYSSNNNVCRFLQLFNTLMFNRSGCPCFLGGGGGTCNRSGCPCFLGGGGGELVTEVGGHVSWCSIHSMRLGAGSKAASELESCPSARRSTEQDK